MSQSAFDKLRIASPALMLGAALAGGTARGATTSTGFDVTTGGVSYSEFSNSTVDLATGAGDIGSGYGISDATLTGPDQGDAFDDFGGIAVNRTLFNQPNDQVDLTTTADGTFVSTLTPQDIGGIATSLDYFMDASSPTLRVLATFGNTTGGALSGIEVLYGGNLGSGDTQIEATSSGDAVFQQADRWLISSDGGSSPDPLLTFVRYGEGSVQAASGTLAVPDAGEDDFTDQWTLDLAAGETQSLMWFVQFTEYPNVNDAITNAAVFADLDTLASAGLLAAVGGGSIDTGNIVNWAPGTPVPVPGVLPLVGLGLFGLAAVRRRRRG
ncbi:PEP-CTERM sorting domain-containing protein [uncultured Thiohalocapsa sp.]|uniref:PEP-CTERM sorting domain-containing protein n=1 Tax=uncultured Thiohalocapsa sp. TaxID=768990 RepID=UPI0025CFF9F8|nr:PEP-CTERM sorting domain-containing protein [uncultured Thiohalocapsa sp.]